MPTLANLPFCTVDEIPIGQGRPFVVGDRRVAVFRSRTGTFFATDDRCPHKGGPLADGVLVGDQIVCPLHAFRFRAGSGECDQPGVCAVQTYPVEVNGNDVVVTVPIG
jgi:nitrite reductase (NADH) small subunit